MLVDVHRNVNVRQKPASGQLPRWVEVGDNQAFLDLVVSLLGCSQSMFSPSSDHFIKAGEESLEVQALGEALRNLPAVTHFVEPSLGQGCHRIYALDVKMGSIFKGLLGSFFKCSLSHTRKTRGKWKVVNTMVSTLLLF